MRIALGCVLAGLVCGACVAPPERCQGPLQQINPSSYSPTSQTPTPTEPDESRP
jgi:hypothetical protein